MRIAVLPLLAAAFCAVPSAAARESAPGILLLHVDAATAAQSVPVIRVVRDRLSRAWAFPALGGLVNVPWKDEECAPGRIEAGRTAMLATLRDGADRFFRQTDLSGGAASLGQGMEAFFEHSCRLGRTSEDVREVCRAAVLLVRIRIMQGLDEQAAALARRIAEVLPEPCVSAVDAPPEISAFLSGLRRDVEAGRAERTISLADGAHAEGVTLVVNGRPEAGAGPWRVRLPPGRHEFAFLTPQGEVLAARPMIRPETSDLEFDLRISAGCSPCPEETICCPPPADPTALARRIASSSGASVFVIRGLGTPEGVRVASVTTDATEAGVLEMRLPPGQDGKAELLVPDGSPLAKKALWPWPFLAAGASAGLLVSGVLLNMKSNEAAAAVNRGINRESDRSRWKTAAIACYAASGCAAGAAVLLEILRPAPATRFLVPLPGPDGTVTVGVSGQF